MSPRVVWLCLALTTLIVAPASRGKVRSVQRTFPGGPGASLTTDSYRGTIEVDVSPDRQFHLEIVLDPQTDDPAESDRLLDQVKTEIKREGTAISIHLRNPSETRPHFEFSSQPRRVSIYCHYLVPQACSLDLSTNFGGITVGSLTGRLKARTKNGTIFCRHIEGDVDARNEKGDIVVSHCDGSAHLAVLVGDIRAGTIVGRAEARATNGDIEVQHAHGGGQFSAKVGNATVGLPDDLAGPAAIDTDFGNILIRIDSATHCSIQATSDLGRIRLNALLPLELQSGGNGKKSLVGKLNGGGPIVTLKAKGGQIRIEGSGD